MNQTLEFVEFLNEVAQTSFETNTTANGLVTIQQSTRNAWRKRGVEALKHDLEQIYGAHFDIVETKDGIVIAAENEPGDFTFSWELKSTIKALDYDPFVEASNYDEAQAQKAQRKLQKEEEKAARATALAEKRARRLAKVSGDIED